jgi:hypothetical protein
MSPPPAGEIPIAAATTPPGWSVFGDLRAGYLHPTDRRRCRRMLAAIGLGLIGTILLIVLVIAAIMFFLRRA